MTKKHHKVSHIAALISLSFCVTSTLAMDSQHEGLGNQFTKKVSIHESSFIQRGLDAHANFLENNPNVHFTMRLFVGPQPHIKTRDGKEIFKPHSHMTMAYLADIPSEELKQLLTSLEQKNVPSMSQPVLRLGEIVRIGEHLDILAYKVDFDDISDDLTSKFYTDHGRFETAQIKRAEKQNIVLQKSRLPDICHITIGQENALRSQGITQGELEAHIGVEVKGLRVDIKPVGRFSPIVNQDFTSI